MVCCFHMDIVRSISEFLVPAAQAHEKWFIPVDPVTAPIPEFYLSANFYTITVASVVLVAGIVGYVSDKRYEKSKWYGLIEARIRPYRDYAAGILAITTGFALLWAAGHNQLLATNYPLPAGIGGTVLRVVEAVVGGLLMVGLFTPAAAVGLMALYASSFLLYPAIEPIDYVNFFGIGLFLLFFARGRYSLDWFLGKPILTTPAQRKWAYLALRVLTGFTLMWLGLLKLRRPDLHFSLMDKYPNFNPYVIMGWFGINMTREMYVFCLFVVEATVGLFEMLGLYTRVLAVALVPVMVVSVVFLGPGELVGHLPILGTLFVLFAYGDTYHKHRDDKRFVHPAQADEKKPG